MSSNLLQRNQHKLFQEFLQILSILRFHLVFLGKLDGNEELIKFAETLERVCVDCVEEGSMTKDLAILIGPSTKYLTTNQFLDTIDGKLRQKLN